MIVVCYRSRTDVVWPLNEESVHEDGRCRGSNMASPNFPTAEYFDLCCLRLIRLGAMPHLLPSSPTEGRRDVSDSSSRPLLPFFNRSLPRPIAAASAHRLHTSQCPHTRTKDNLLVFSPAYTVSHFQNFILSKQTAPVLKPWYPHQSQRYRTGSRESQ